jgi:hypothetical protein
MTIDLKPFDDQRLRRLHGIIEHHRLQKPDGAGEAPMANPSGGTLKAEEHKTPGKGGAGVTGG